MMPLHGRNAMNAVRAACNLTHPFCHLINGTHDNGRWQNSSSKASVTEVCWQQCRDEDRAQHAPLDQNLQIALLKLLQEGASHRHQRKEHHTDTNANSNAPHSP